MSRHFFVLVKILTLIVFILSVPGCGNKSSPDQNKTVSATQLVADSLNVMKNADSYRFHGVGKVQYIGIGGYGEFTATGAYKSPGYSHMKMKMKLGKANYHSETFYKKDAIYLLSNEYWRKVPFDPNTLIQPGYKPVHALLAQVPEISLNAVFLKDDVINGKKVKVVRILSNSKKFKLFLQKQLHKTISREPDRRQELTNFLKNCSVLQNYTLYIDPETKYIVRILFRQNVRISLANKKTETHMDADYTIYDFGSGVDLPSLPIKIK